MRGSELTSRQEPIKHAYREDPERAMVTLRASGRLGEESIACSVDIGRAMVEAGLHPATGGDGTMACSGDMLLQALVACAGVTLRAVATALDVPVRGGAIRAEGDLDFRGTLGVDRDVAVGFQRIRLFFELDADTTEEQLETLLRLTERYCVVYQTLVRAPSMEVAVAASGLSSASATPPPTTSRGTARPGRGATGGPPTAGAP